MRAAVPARAADSGAVNRLRRAARRRVSALLEADWRSHLPRLLLLAILAGAFGLRAWGSDFGLPAYTRYHPDEQALVERAAGILRTGDWNLHRYNYPPFYAYLQAGSYAAYFVWGAAQGAWNLVPPVALPQFYQVGRLLTAFMGCLTVVVVYLVGGRLQGQRVALLSAALMAGCYLHVIHSHYATFDVMVGLLAVMTLLFSELLRTGGDQKWYFLAGLCAGLAGATKYNGAVALGVPLIAHILASRRGEWGWLNRGVLLTLLGFAAGFFGGNPYALGDTPEFLNGLAQVFYHYGTQHPGFEGRGNWKWYPGVFLTSADALWAVVGTLGLAGLLRREWRRGLMVACFPVLYYAMMSRFVVRFERNMVPILPFLALGGGWLIDSAACRLARRAGHRRGLSHGLAGLGLALVLVLPVSAALSFDAAISQTDLREVAGQWVTENVAAGSKIAIESYSIPFDHSRYRVEDVVRAGDHSVSWYRSQGFDLVIVSDGVWEVLRRQPQIYTDQVQAFEELVAGSTLLREFEPRPPALAAAGYPTVRVYHFAPVRIYQVQR